MSYVVGKLSIEGNELNLPTYLVDPQELIDE